MNNFVDFLAEFQREKSGYSNFLFGTILKNSELKINQIKCIKILILKIFKNRFFQIFKKKTTKNRLLSCKIDFHVTGSLSLTKKGFI